MKKGPLSKAEKEFIDNNQSMDVKDISKKLDRSERVLSKYMKITDTPANNLFATKPERGVVVMTESASTAADDIMAYVVDDPKLVFQMQGDEAIAQTGLGNNVSAVSTAGSPTIGRSKNALDGGSIATTNTLPLRIVEFVDGPTSSVGDTYTDCLVTYLPLSHAYETALGV